MGQYFEFLLNLAGEGDDRTIADSLAFAPIDAVLPKNAFVCKVICDATAKVFVIACAEGGGHEVIALGKFGEGGIRHRKQLRDSTVPTSYQWDLFEAALRKNAMLATGHRPGHDTVVDLDQLLRTLKAKRRAFGDPPSELPSSIDPAEPPPRRTPRRVWIAIGIGVAVLGIGVAVTRAKRSRTPPPPAVVAPTPMTPPAPEPAVAPPVEPTPAVPSPPVTPPPATLADAIAQHRKELVDTDDEMSPGARKLATFAAAKLVWADVDGPAETTIAHVLKDSEAERGKRLCTEGVIRSIERRDLDGRKVFVGRLRTDDDEIAFVAVGSTGDLVRKTRGTLCGVVAGKSRGAVALVGMFDLPENRRPIVEQ